MDLLKRHFEKILLGIALVALIASAVYLSLQVDQLRERINTSAGSGALKGSPVKPINLAPYQTALQSLHKPDQWTGQVALFPPTDAPSFITVVGDVPYQRQKPKYVGNYRPLFPLMFMDYSGEGYNFQINIRDRRYSFIVPQVGDYISNRYENTGWQLVKFDRQVEQVYRPDIDRTNNVDTSQITLAKPGVEPIVLALRKPADQPGEIIGYWSCEKDGAARKQVRKGETIECDGATYKVVDITLQQMIIVDLKSKDQAEERIPLTPSGP
jgi:hypothetical protein